MEQWRLLMKVNMLKENRNFIDTIVEKKSCVPKLFEEICNQKLPLVLLGTGVTASYLYDILIENRVLVDEVVVDDKYFSQKNSCFKQKKSKH